MSADAYERYMGRYSAPLAPLFCDASIPSLNADHRVLDVGCGPGMLTAELARRVGEPHVAAVDPSPPFVTTTSGRFPAADVQQASAEQLPFQDDSFDAALAQLVVHFMSDPAAGAREMARVTRPGGPVATCLWDQAGGTGPMSRFWQVAGRLDPSGRPEGRGPGTTEGELVGLLRHAGLSDVRPARLTVSVAFRDFDDWWEPFTFGVGPTGDYVRALSPERLAALEQALRETIPAGPFEVVATACCAVGIA